MEELAKDSMRNRCKVLSGEIINNCGIEFTGEVCYSGEYGEQLH